MNNWKRVYSSQSVPFLFLRGRDKEAYLFPVDNENALSLLTLFSSRTS